MGRQADPPARQDEAGFNEAAAVRPQMVAARRARRGCNLRFNEAAAVRPQMASSRWTKISATARLQ